MEGIVLTGAMDKLLALVMGGLILVLVAVILNSVSRDAAEKLVRGRVQGEEGQTGSNTCMRELFKDAESSAASDADKWNRLRVLLEESEARGRPGSASDVAVAAGASARPRSSKAEGTGDSDAVVVGGKRSGPATARKKVVV